MHLYRGFVFYGHEAECRMPTGGGTVVALSHHSNEAKTPTEQRFCLSVAAGAEGTSGSNGSDRAAGPHGK